MNKYYLIAQPHIQAKIIGTILIGAGTGFIFIPFPIFTKVGLTSILIGFFMIFMIQEKIEDTQIIGNLEPIKGRIKLLISEKITLIVTAFILISLIITIDIALEMFFALIFIGILIGREFTDKIINMKLKTRFDAFIYLCVIIFIVLIGKNIIIG